MAGRLFQMCNGFVTLFTNLNGVVMNKTTEATSLDLTLSVPRKSFASQLLGCKIGTAL